MGRSCSAGTEGKNCKFVPYSVFSGKPVQGLKSGGGLMSAAYPRLQIASCYMWRVISFIY
jgi:hypothetical protein